MSEKSIADTIGEISESIESFKADHASRLDKMETRMSRPGALHQHDAAPAHAPEFVDQKTGAPLLCIKSGDNVAAKLAQKGQQTETSGDTIGDFFRGVAGMKAHGELTRKSLAAGTDSAGGYMLPTNVFGNVLQAMTAESTVMSAGAQVVLLDGPDGAKSYTFAAVQTVPTASWRLENGNVAESDPVFRAVTVVPKSLAFFFKVSRELLGDAANLSEVIRLAAAQAFAKELDRVALLGTGADPQPRGLANLSGVQAVSNTANGASLATTKFANLFSGAQAILNADGPMPTAAISSHRTRVGLASLVATDGQPLQTPGMLQGIRMLSTSQISNALTVGTSSDCSQMFMGDFRYLGYAMRESLSVRALEQTFATTGQVGFFCHARVDVFVTHPSVFAVVTGIRP